MPTNCALARALASEYSWCKAQILGRQQSLVASTTCAPQIFDLRWIYQVARLAPSCGYFVYGIASVLVFPAIFFPFEWSPQWDAVFVGLEMPWPRVDLDLKQKANPRPRFADCAARYLAQSQNMRSVDVAAWHVRLLTSYVGTLEIQRIHDGTLERFVADRVASGVTATTINRSLEVARTILNRAARSYRDSDGRPWL